MGKEEDMAARNWGWWNIQYNRFVPFMSTMNAATDILLKITHWNCSAVLKHSTAPVECGNSYNSFLPEESEYDE